ncbi:MAG: hypothetical protein ACI358_09255 [Candidatus Limimorpha sp.]
MKKILILSVSILSVLCFSSCKKECNCKYVLSSTGEVLTESYMTSSYEECTEKLTTAGNVITTGSICTWGN